MRRMKDKYDVIILGTGIGGCELGCILARQGLSVLMLDAETHPHFAVGESTIPETTQLVSLIANEFDVPELHQLGLNAPAGIRKHVGPTCGIKRAFGFAYHRLNQTHDPYESHQFGNVWRDENHLFRQDIDAYLMRLSLKLGAHVLTGTRVQSVEFSEQEVQVHSSAGSFKAEFLADGTGHRSVVAEKFGLRENPCRFQHHCRTIFTHMIDVKPFEQCVENKMSTPWSQTTLHHVFDGGWIWVIPFNNWEGSTNPIVSVGIQLDPRKYPSNEKMDPEDEFYHFLERLPSAKLQFQDAKAVRPWVRTGRLQYSSSKSVGHRWCLLSHASGFIDPLYSRGLINTSEVNYTLAKALISAARDKDYSAERFSHLEETHRRTVGFADRLVNSSFISWSNFDVWNVFWRLWVTGPGCVESNLGSHLLGLKFPSMLKPLVENPLFSRFEEKGYKEFFMRSEKLILEFEAGKLSAEDTAKRIERELNHFNFLMTLPNGSSSHIWAIKNPDCRDLFLGSEALQQRWETKNGDPQAA